jgi:Carboxypeptidase regulatory-like domain/TonB dependent receptor-like, beta-barrel
MKLARTFALAMLFCSVAAMLGAQGVQTGTVRGVVQDEQGLAVPGVTVTATSPALQGPRVVISDAQGGFVFPNLPPGNYEVKFELSGFATVTQNTAVPLGGIIQQNVTMRAAGLTETVQVVAESPAPIATPIVGINIKHEEIEALATPRTLQGIATLSPALSEQTPNGGQLVINGGFAFDNIFMVNGVDVNDNLFANPQNLFIEDAIEETQVLTSGISAEYGRFGGGVVNAITKSGGNRFSGSGRVNFLNPSWSKETPFEVGRNVTRPDINQQTYEGTFGGPISKDHLWFFSAGRYASVENPQTIQESGVQVIQDDLNKRGEIKLTGTVRTNHTIQGGYLNNSREVSNTSGLFSLVADPRSLITRSLPNNYYFTNYRGVLGGGMLVEGQYSQRHFEFQGDGIDSSTNMQDSPFYSPEIGVIYNSPYFCACDPEQRNNRQMTAAVTNFWSASGTHQTKVGYEFFRSQRTGGNSQSATQYVFNTDYVVDGAGAPVLDAQGRFIPIFTPGLSSIDFFPATIGATLNVDNNSLYFQDHWAINSRWSADLGARYEHVNAVSSGDITSVNNNRIVPRLGTAYDIQGNGSHIIHLTYGQYSGRYNEALVGANSPVGNPSDIFSLYRGPAGQGIGFAAGLNPVNYPVRAGNASVTVPTANVFTDPSMKSPLVHEFTTSYGANIANGKGYAEVAYVFRKTTSIIEDFITREDGTTVVEFSGINAGEVSNQVYRNTPDAHRQYQGMVFQGRYQVSNRWTVNGQYTLQLQNEGNFAGEGTNTPGSTSRLGDYPEAFAPEAQRFYPDGRLDSFQRHRVRAWTIYNFGMGRAGDLSVSGLWRVDSGGTYSLFANSQPLTATQLRILENAGYPDSPDSSTLYFGARGSEEFPAYGLLDANISYNIPVGGSVRPWVKFDIYNLLNNQKLIEYNTTIRPDPNSPLDSLGYRTGFIRGNSFGTGTAQTHYPVPFGGQTGGRTFRAAVGVRF